MTILGEHPWLILFYLISVGIHLAVTLKPEAVWLGWVCGGFHAAVLTAFFLTGAALEDVLLYLLVSAAAALAFALLLPDRRDGAEKTSEDGEETK